jgi:hypothetical protein
VLEGGESCPIVVRVLSFIRILKFKLYALNYSKFNK